MKYFTFISILVLLFSQPTMLWAGSYQNFIEMGDFFNSAGKTRKAYEKYLEAYANASTEHQKKTSLASLAVTSLKLDKRAESEKYLKKLLSLFPNNEWAMQFAKENMLLSYARATHRGGKDRVVICKNRHKTRILTLDYLVAGSRVPCQVIYEKPTEQPGYREVLWKAQKKVGYCEEKMNNFVRNQLEGQWGWHCSTEHSIIPPAPKGKTVKDTDSHADKGYICTREKGSRVNLRTGPGTHFPKGVIRGDSEWLQINNYTTEDGAIIDIYSKTRGKNGYFWYLVGQSWTAWVRSDMVCR